MTGARQAPFALLLAATAACSGASATPTPEEYYSRGIAALEQGRPRAARAALFNALHGNPRDLRARLAQARASLLLGDGVAAESEIRRARDAGAPQAETRALLAHALLLQGEPRRAIAEIEGAAGPDAAYAARIRARSLFALGEEGAAAAEFVRAAELGPRDSQVWTDIAGFRRSTGDVAAAIAAADQAVALDPRNDEALRLRGELTRSQYGLSGALPWFNRALEIDPDDVITLLERAATLADLGRMEEMLADTRRVLSLQSGNAMAFYLQAMLAARAGEFELAQTIWQRTEGRFDETPAGMLLGGAIDYESGNVAQAARRLERLVEQQPANRKARRLLAAAQWRLGDAAATIATLRPIAERADADSYSLSLIGRALARQGDTRAAAAFLFRAALPQGRAAAALDMDAVSDEQLAALRRAAAERRDAPTEVALVAALLARGFGAEALDRALALQRGHPGAPDAHVLVGDARGLAGDHAGAADEYRKAANLAFTEPVALRLIEALQRSGQQAAADRVLQLFLQQNPRNVPALVLLAARYMQVRDWAGATGIYEGLRRRLGDRDATILNNLALAYSEQGDHARAVPLARRAWELDLGNPGTADTLGWVLFRSGARAEGLALLQRALRGAPSDAEIRRHLEAARRG
ncbi:MAG TPA: tetratricopeptide repeat protein [Allosphingosinicella sp.]|nr:tetratricopeptide repeat protein [Allosphingosinicella sp.]